MMGREADYIDDVVKMVTRFGAIDGEHHKQWLLDQVMQTLLQRDYQKWRDEYDGEDGYDPWDEGIAP